MRTEKPSNSEFILQKIPSDIGIHRNPRKGTLNAPEKILEDFETEKKVLVDEVFTDEFSLENTHDRILENTEELIEYDLPVISIGGDHSVSYPVVKALKQENPEMELVWLDSHLDVKKKVDDHVSHDVVVRKLVEEGLFDPDEITFVGITKVDHDEEEYLEDKGFNLFRAGEVSDFLDKHESKEECYLSIDIDVLSEEEALGTGYPDGQLSLGQVQKVVRKVQASHADIVEVAPPFDKDGKTVENARKILKEILELDG